MEPFYFSLFKGEADERLAELVDIANFPVISSNLEPAEASPLYDVRDTESED